MSRSAGPQPLSDRDAARGERAGPGAALAELARTYHAADFFVVRSPAESFDRLAEWCAGASNGELAPDGAADAEQWSSRRVALGAHLQTVFAQPAMQRALYFASPELEAVCGAAQALTPQLSRTLTRYFMRAAGRETPFGLFAGVSLARIADRSHFELEPAQANRCTTSLSAHYLQRVLGALVSSASERDALPHRPSSTLVRLDGRYRFTASAPLASELHPPRAAWVLLDLAATPQVERALSLAAAGLSLEQLARRMASDAIPYVDALLFARTLADRGVLRPELLPGATGYDLEAALAQLAELPSGQADAHALSAALHALAECDVARSAAGAAPFRHAIQSLSERVPPAPGQHSLHTTLVKPAPDLTMSEDVAALFLDAASILQRTSGRAHDDTLAGFAARFSERYGSATVPLAEALDNEIGVDFGDPRETDPLLQGVRPVRAAAAPPPFDEFDGVRQKLLHRALRSGASVFELDDQLLSEFPTPPEVEHEAESLVVVARLARDAAGRLSVIDPSVMPSALKMLARFCAAEPALVGVLRQHAAREQALAGSALLADVAYLPDSKAANILVRPVLRDYEIPYLGKSGAPASQQIPVDDLYVRVHGERVQLYSGRHGQRVKIRIGNALNHNHLSHPALYRFLTAVQAQDEASFCTSWSWGRLRTSEFLPRIVRGSTVLSLASWQLSSHDLEPALEADGARAFYALQAVRARLRLPRWLTRGVGDQRLPVDLDNELSVEELLHEARQQRGLAVQELLPTPDQLVLRGPEGAYAGEFVVPFLRRVPHREAPAAPVTVSSGAALTRHHAPGSDWLYAKFYAAPARIEALLKRVRSDVLAPYRQAGFDTWFYLPFADPYPHLRVRFKADPAFLHGSVLPALQRVFEIERARGSAWRLQVDTYEQEQERYGGPLGVQLAEQIFAADSEACSTLSDLCERGSDFRWQVALLGIDRLLSDLGFDVTGRLTIARAASRGYAAEAGVDLAMRTAIGAKYRAQSARLNELLWLTPGSAHGREQQALRALAERSTRVRAISKRIERARRAGQVHASGSDLARSFAHMHAVRLLGVEARAHELLLFEFLQRLYASRLARTAGVERVPASSEP